MIETFFNGDKYEQIIKFVVLAICITLIVVALIKWPNGRIFVFSFLFLALVATSIYSAIELNVYYSAQGGIYGALKQFVNPTQVTALDSKTFDFEGIELRRDRNNDYVAVVSTTDVVNVPTGSSYVLLVNDMPCEVKQEDSSSDYLIGYYSYTFLDDEKQEILSDTLSIRLAFYNKITTIKITTSGGERAVTLWNQFFGKNGFTIVLTTDRYLESQLIEFGTGNIDNYRIVRFVDEDNVIVQPVLVGKNANIEDPYKAGFTFMGWSVNGRDIVDLSSYRIDEDVTFNALYKDTLLDGLYSLRINYGTLVSFKIIDNAVVEFSSSRIANNSMAGYSMFCSNVMFNESFRFLENERGFTFNFYCYWALENGNPVTCSVTFKIDENTLEQTARVSIPKESLYMYLTKDFTKTDF